MATAIRWFSVLMFHFLRRICWKLLFEVIIRAFLCVSLTNVLPLLNPSHSNKMAIQNQRDQIDPTLKSV